MNITRLARLMAERHGAYDGALKMEARADYYSKLAEDNARDHRGLSQFEYTFRAMFWYSVGRVCITKYSYKEGVKV